jgi:hypothetical protein
VADSPKAETVIVKVLRGRLARSSGFPFPAVAAEILDALRSAGYDLDARYEAVRTGPYPWVWSEREQAVCYRTWGGGDDVPVFRRVDTPNGEGDECKKSSLVVCEGDDHGYPKGAYE